MFSANLNIGIGAYAAVMAGGVYKVPTEMETVLHAQNVSDQKAVDLS